MLKIAVTCIHCQTKHIIAVDQSGYALWIQGTLIQKALPNNTDAERELLISQTCSTCWDSMFSEDDIEEADAESRTIEE